MLADVQHLKSEASRTTMLIIIRVLEAISTTNLGCRSPRSIMGPTTASAWGRGEMALKTAPPRSSGSGWATPTSR